MKHFKNYFAPFLFAGSLIPLDPAHWHIIKYDKIKANVVSFENSELKIKVDQSNSVVVSAFPKVQQVQSFEVDLEFSGVPKLDPQKNKWEEDSPFRLGLVAPGKNTLGGFKKLFVKKWVEELFQLVPSGQGLDKVYFFNLTQKKESLGDQRTHPASSYFFETLAQYKNPEETKTKFKYTLKNPLPVSALWISTDGDNTQSNFDVVIKKMELF